MNEKILIADDSATIQKVIGITLADSDYNMKSVLSYGEMVDTLKNQSFDLILLDFNLSEEKDGYKLCEEVYNLSNKTKIIAMLGTFDSVDDSKLEQFNVLDRIIKPFESSQFIRKVQDVIEDSSDDLLANFSLEEEASSRSSQFEESTKEIILGDSLSQEPEDNAGSTDENEWSINAPSENVIAFEDKVEEMVSKSEEQVDPSVNELHSEMIGWGIEVPPVIGEGGQVAAPPVVNQAYNLNDIDNLANSDDSSIEDEASELTGEYDTASMNVEVSPTSEDKDEKIEETKPKVTMASFISADDLVPEEDEESDEDEVDVEVTQPHIILSEGTEDFTLEEQVNNDEDNNDFWAADEAYDEQDSVEPLEEKVEVADTEEVGPKIEVANSEAQELVSHNDEVGPKIEEIHSNTEVVTTNNDSSIVLSSEEVVIEDDIKVSNNQEESSAESVSQVDKDEIVKLIIAELHPQLTALVKEEVGNRIEEINKSSVETVAWEVIPELAENLIKEELGNLSKSIQDKYSLS